MNDRELLQLAAKAAGYDVVFVHDDKISMRRDAVINGRRQGMKHWNSITDDGDALRLAVKLFMFDTRRLMEIRAELTRADPSKSDEEIMRRAITLCAAEIGRRMG